MTKTMKAILAKEQDRIDILQDKNLLYNIIKEIKKKVAGNEDVMLALIVKICLRLVNNANPTSSNVLISDDSGSGKDWVTLCVCDTMIGKKSKEYEHVTDISDKLLNYWTIPKKDGGTFDGMVLHLEDPAMDRICSQAFKVRASGQNAVKFVDKGKAKHIHIEGKPVMIITSLLATIDEEGARRWDSLRMDKTIAVTKLMKKMYADIAAGTANIEPNEQLKTALSRNLIKRTVVIPFAPALIATLPDTIIMRTQQQKLLDYIKASAVLHQYQRHRTKEGHIIANLDDYDYARFCFLVLGDGYGVVLSKAEEEVVKVLTEHGTMMAVRDIIPTCGRGKQWMYEHLPQMKEKGILKEDSYWDETSNKYITRYGIHPDYDIATNTSMPSIVVVRGSIGLSDDTTDNHPTEGIDRKLYIGEVGCPQFQVCVREVDKDRNKDGLPCLFSHPENSGQPPQPLYSRKKTTESVGCPKIIKQPTDNQDNQTSFDLFQQIQNLQKYISDNQKAGYPITMEFLKHKFSQHFIQHCIKDKIIHKKGDDEWEIVQ